MAKEKENKERRKKPEKPAPAPVPVSLDLKIDFDKAVLRMLAAGFKEVTAQVTDAVVSQIQLDEEAEGKAARTLDRNRKKIAKIITKAVGFAAGKVPNLPAIVISSMMLDGNRATTGDIALPMRADAATRLAAAYSGLLNMMNGEKPEINDFKKFPETIKGGLGTSLPDGHFMAGE
ncbi:MAG: hypothetical protein AAF570_02695, partial [Bacteroidota bacterium]